MTPQRQVWQGIDSVSPYVVIGIGNGGYPFLQNFEDLVLGERTGASHATSSSMCLS